MTILLFGLFGHSMGFCDNAGISTSVRNFPQHKGSAVGLMKAMEGLTAAVANTVFFSFLGDNDMEYFPLAIAFTGLAVGLTAAPIIRWANDISQEEEKVVSRKFSFLTVALLAYTGFCGVVVYLKAYSWPIALVAALLPFGLLLLTRSSSRQSLHPGSLLARREVERPDISAWQMLQKVDFYLLFFAFVSIQGAGIMLSNNFSQIVKAVSEDASASSAGYLSLFSVFNTCGRIFIGFGSESAKDWLNRPWFLGISACLMTLAFVLLQLGEVMLAPAAGLVGFGLGGSFALQAVVIEEIFGPKEMPVKYSCVFTAACVGSLVLSDLLAGCLYDAEAERQGAEIEGWRPFPVLVCQAPFQLRVRREVEL
ncbi:unnamed protein product [Effrenium voratum]|uniref:Uncharacterized protein n=1 Tax=Effrenium voratum TaxID=2562239 RepID=A0AA36MVI4_9DINO|nr:unnamed protein product [Effrenium voratum]